MLELSLQPTKYGRENGQTVYTWDYNRLLFGRPIALDVLGVAPIDRSQELEPGWGHAAWWFSACCWDLARYAFAIQNFDRWMLPVSFLGTFTGAYPLMYFAQEFVPLDAAIVGSAVVVLIIIAVRLITITGIRFALFEWCCRPQQFSR